ncbi:flagellar biosynthesis protein FlhA [Inmirania thermothiophila]|uniref:Flagellar biosynthesis protein FlhA n=1 Tax=Inmirania thermothiophila TaxID=1750597 RepID=A0A3N1Y802_9GAMM|nr:flagellar biosynthesis protein FlhA [Inmirania thermothiophila]ROR34943.1 flagellar biosynthesis protein FlhA [Inmirania thermothiophila]
MATSAAVLSVRSLTRYGLGAPLLLVMIMAMVVLPLPPLALDAFFTFNISLSLVVLLAAVYAQRPLDFAVFPTVLLMATLLRLALNVASTRVVLLRGHTGSDAAGRVIEAFGQFVVGGSYTVGLVVFVILVIINFVVVTRGAGRVSEVSARFTLDAMPGKQMAIDADLNAGLITQDEARARREEIAREADFYGAMDGASKFVRGDAIAGILILFINILGGVAVGTAQHGLPLGEAFRNYTLLTIGDGLVAQIPSLLLSTAAAIMVTRVSAAQDLGSEVLRQVFSSPRVLGVTAGIVGVLGTIPGMPNLPFLTLAAVAGGAAWWMTRRARAEVVEEAEPEAPPHPREPELTWDDVQPVDPIGLEVGYRLIPLVDRTQGGQLMPRIKGVRKKLTQELGFLVPAVHIRDNLDLSPNAYRITLNGVPVGEAEVHPDRELAINPGQAHGRLQGLATKDPAFGLDAVWIEPAQREHAQTLGYTVVDAATVIATHLSQVLRTHAHELLGFEEVQHLLEVLGRKAPKLVEELVPRTLSMATVLRVLQNLLVEGVPIRDIRTICETLAEHGPRTQDPDALTGAVRVALGRAIVQGIVGGAAELRVATLDPALEQLVQQSLQVAGAGGGAGLEPGLAEQIHRGVSEAAARIEASGQPPVLVVGGAVRAWLSRFLRPSIPGLHVLAYNELPDGKQIRVVATVGQQQIAAG